MLCRSCKMMVLPHDMIATRVVCCCYPVDLEEWSTTIDNVSSPTWTFGANPHQPRNGDVAHLCLCTTGGCPNWMSHGTFGGHSPQCLMVRILCESFVWIKDNSETPSFEHRLPFPNEILCHGYRSWPPQFPNSFHIGETPSQSSTKTSTNKKTQQQQKTTKAFLMQILNWPTTTTTTTHPHPPTPKQFWQNDLQIPPFFSRQKKHQKSPTNSPPPNHHFSPPPSPTHVSEYYHHHYNCCFITRWSLQKSILVGL